MSIAGINSNAASISGVADKAGMNEPTVIAVKDAVNQNAGTADTENQAKVSNLQDIADQLNDFMQSISTDIKFELHAETSTLIIQIEDSKTHKILKEVPSHELLDMVTKIKECIGAFLDKKV